MKTLQIEAVQMILIILKTEKISFKKLLSKKIKDGSKNKIGAVLHNTIFHIAEFKYYRLKHEFSK